MDNQGWIKIHRKILEWKWHDNPVVGWLFIHCLLSANHDDGYWKGILVKKGSFITSQPHLAKKTGLSVMQVRFALDKLKLTGELTVKTTNKYSVITINNWSKYQDINSQINSQLTGKQQAINRQLTTNKNNKNNKNEEKEEKYINTPQGELVSFFSSVFEKRFQKPYLPFKSDYINMSSLLKKYSMDQLKKYISWYIYWDSWQTKSGYTIGKFYRHINEVISSASPYKY